MASRKQEETKQANILLSKYQKLYRDRVGQQTINRYKAKWGMLDVIDSVGYDRASELLDFYFTTDESSHRFSLEFFYRNFDRLDSSEKEICADRARRARLRTETEQRIRERQD